MVSKKNKNAARLKRHIRVRGKISGTAERPRLCVYRSTNNISAQIIDDVKGITLVSASSYGKEFGEGGNKEAAKKVGQLIAEKAKDVRESLATQGAQSMLLTKLDDIAWFLNLRGNDVECNPVVISYLYVSKSEIRFFVQDQALTNEVKRYLVSYGVAIEPYENVFAFIGSLADEGRKPLVEQSAVLALVGTGVILVGELLPLGQVHPDGRMEVDTQMIHADARKPRNIDTPGAEHIVGQGISSRCHQALTVDIDLGISVQAFEDQLVVYERLTVSAVFVEEETVLPRAVGNPLHFRLVVTVERVRNQLVGQKVVVDVARDGGGMWSQWPLVRQADLPFIVDAAVLRVEIPPLVAGAGICFAPL